MNKTKQELLSNCQDNYGQFYAYAKYGESRVHEAMDEWADIKLGEYIAKQSSSTETLEVPEHILSEYAKKESVAYRKFCQSEIKVIMASMLTELDEDFDDVAYRLYLQSKTK